LFLRPFFVQGVQQISVGQDDHLVSLLQLTVRVGDIESIVPIETDNAGYFGQIKILNFFISLFLSCYKL